MREKSVSIPVTAGKLALDTLAPSILQSQHKVTRDMRRHKFNGNHNILTSSVQAAAVRRGTATGHRVFRARLARYIACPCLPPSLLPLLLVLLRHPMWLTPASRKNRTRKYILISSLVEGIAYAVKLRHVIIRAATQV